MEDDWHKTYKEIHGTREAWFTSIEQTIDEALVKAQDDDAPLRLRFLKRLRDESNCHDFVVTTLAEVTSETHYIAVSYCWKQPEALEELRNIAPVPEYRIWDLDRTSYRAPRCNLQIFHRAARFAACKECPLLWIDQECINQSDPLHIEQHLGVMDRVYRDSLCTVAPLGTAKPVEESIAKTLVDHVEAGRDYPFTYPDSSKSLCDNDWFCRAWTFQERLCATSLCLLITVDMESLHIGSDKLMFVQEDLGVKLHEVCKDGLVPHQVFAVSDLRQRARQVILGCPTSSTDLYQLMVDLERCECSVMADRLSIIGNVCDLPWRFRSDQLNREGVSLSTCVLALLLANRLPLRKDRERLYAHDQVLNNWFFYRDGFMFLEWHMLARGEGMEQLMLG